MKKKGKTVYTEDIYPSKLEVQCGGVWVKASWSKSHKWWETEFMSVMVFAWWNADGKIVAMGHQSLQ